MQTSVEKDVAVSTSSFQQSRSRHSQLRSISPCANPALKLSPAALVLTGAISGTGT
jgi:hypothetical protein